LKFEERHLVQLRSSHQTCVEESTTTYKQAECQPKAFASETTPVHNLTDYQPKKEVRRIKGLHTRQFLLVGAHARRIAAVQGSQTSTNLDD